MPGSSFGDLFRVTNFGESHGPAIGCVIDGCPPGLALSEADIQGDLDRRHPVTLASSPARPDIPAAGAEVAAVLADERLVAALGTLLSGQHFQRGLHELGVGHC